MLDCTLSPYFQRLYLVNKMLGIWRSSTSTFILPFEDCSSGSRKHVVFNHFSQRSFLNFNYVPSWLRPFNIFTKVLLHLSESTCFPCDLI